jgi:hypothetical protein
VPGAAGDSGGGCRGATRGLPRPGLPRARRRRGPPIVLAPSRSEVPARCVVGLELGTAFTCLDNLTLYVTPEFLTLLTDNFPRTTSDMHSPR